MMSAWLVDHKTKNMTPEQKAHDLIDKYDWIDCSNDIKQCVLIVIQECIDTTRGRYGDQLTMEYWLNVRHEVIEIYKNTQDE
jgi:hypothetical protein